MMTVIPSFGKGWRICGGWLLGLCLATTAPRTGSAQAAQQAAVLRAAATHPRPGDKLVIKVPREPLLGDTAAMVNERGEVSLTKLGVVQVSRFTITELQDTLRARYSRYLKDPGIDIVLLRRVSVNGEVAKPNVYYVDVATMLRDVIAKAGGITESGDHNKVTIVRNGDRLRVRNWEQDQTPATDLQSGDEVIVERRNWFALNALPVAGTAIALVTLLATLRR